MNREQIIARFREELRTLEREGERMDALPHVTRCSWTSDEQHGVTAYDLDGNNADKVIRTEIARFAELGGICEWKVFSFDNPPDLLARLRAAGLEVGEREALLVYDLEDGLAPFAGPFPCEVRHIERVEQLADFRAVCEAVFLKDYSRTTNQLAEAIRNGQTGHDAYVAYVGETPVAAGRLYTHPESLFAGFYGGGTLPEHRSQGIYRSLTAARAHAAAEFGARYLQVDALPTSLPILTRVGFAHLADTWPCTYEPA